MTELARKSGFSDGGFYLWRNKFAGTYMPNPKRLRPYEVENVRINKLLAESMVENEVNRETLQKRSSSRTGTAAVGDVQAPSRFKL